MRENRKHKSISKEGYRWNMGARSAKSRKLNKRQYRKKLRQQNKIEELNL